MNPRSWYRFLVDRWDALRGSYWFVPGQMALLAAAAALGAIELDRRVDAEHIGALSWLTRVSAESARAVLSTIAGSMMTVTGVVFSITMVALTLTSSQFGPRLLRTFFRDRSSQFSLGLFLATFCYSLLVLRAVESADRVPQIATAGAVGLAIVSLFVLIFFIHHTASSLQASSVIAAVAREIHTQIPILFPEERESDSDGGAGSGSTADPPEVEPDTLAVETDAASVICRTEGYVRILDEDSIVALAREHDLSVRMRARAGTFVTTGASIAEIAPAHRVTDEIAAELLDCCVLGDHRTPVQDVCFLTQQLSEMAVRALSPGVNDPKTAIECIQRLGSVLGVLSSRPFPSGLRRDDDGTLRATFRPTSFEEVAMSCFDSIRFHGAADPQVAIALLRAIEAATCGDLDEDRRECLTTHAHEVHREFARSRDARSEREHQLVEMALDSALRTLGVRGAED